MLAFRDNKTQEIVYANQLWEPLIVCQGSGNFAYALPTDWLIHTHTNPYPTKYADDEFRKRFTFAYNDDLVQLVETVRSRAVDVPTDDCDT